MAYSANEYLGLLQRLLPPGKAWTRAQGARLTEVLTGMAQELARVDAYLESLVGERDSRTTDALIEEHEQDWGLPDECLDTSDLTLEERRVALRSKIITVGQQFKQYYIDIAAALDYTITLQEFRPAWCGIVSAGDPCGGQKVLYHWLVSVFYDKSNPRNGSELLCIFSRLKPAHTTLEWTMYGAGFDYGFGPGFDSLYRPFRYGGFSSGEFNSLCFDTRTAGDFAKLEFDEGFSRPA